MHEKRITLDELCSLSGFSKRTIRYYIQIGLLEHPCGETRAAYYTGKHIEQLLQLKKWSDAGVSLERIREIFDGSDTPLPPRKRRTGDVDVRSHIYIRPGIEIQVSADEADITPEQFRQFTLEVSAAAEKTFSKP
jgi:DNA-binding transcriptional MerR regulator